jgi:hypothetical protein
MGKRRPLVSQHLENISRKALDEYQEVIREHVYGRHGIYALYRRNALYYVGLASNLRNRLKHHLKDRHQKSWDRFSVYLTADDEHMKELESLVLRIVPTKGNKVRGKFAQSENLGKLLQRRIWADVRQRVRDLFGKNPRLAAADRRKGRLTKKRGRSRLPLAGVFPRTVTIRRRYKGNWYRARVRRDGQISYDGKLYDSPSYPARLICNRGVNGWSFWSYEARPRQWVPLQRLRK